MLKSMGERTPPCGTPDLNCRFVDVWFLKYLSMVCGMFVSVSLSINVCMFTVSNALLKSNATTMVRVGGMGWLKPVATVLLMLCSAVFVECLVLNPCGVVMFGMLWVMYGRITFSSVFAITDRRDIDLYGVPMLMSLLLFAFRDLWKEWGDSNFQIFFHRTASSTTGDWSRWNI